MMFRASGIRELDGFPKTDKVATGWDCVLSIR